MTDSTARGATAEEWKHFAVTLGLADDMLPVVNDPDAQPSPDSKVKKFGKIPSRYVDNGAVGIGKWQSRLIDRTLWQNWSEDSRLGFCIRTSRVRAIDVDVSDWDMSVDILALLHEAFGDNAPRRVRSNSLKFLIPFTLDAPLPKRIITTAHGRIELLGDGQQFVAAGMHPSGARYRWTPSLPQRITTVWGMPAIDQLWDSLQQFAIEPEKSKPVASRDAEQSKLLTTISEEEMVRLQDAMRWPAFQESGGSNDVWSEVGYALLSLGQQGYDRFNAWSSMAPNYHEGAPESWWSAHANSPTRTDYRHIFTMARRLGWDTTADLGDFETEEPDRSVATTAPIKSNEQFSLLPEAAAVLAAGAMPEADHLCTDQANANRINARFGSQLRSIGGRFYWFTGTHWEASEGEAARCAAQLNKIVGQEARAAREKFDSLMQELAEEQTKAIDEYKGAARRDQFNCEKRLGTIPNWQDLTKTLEKAEALEKWTKQCEMATVQQKALDMVRKLVTLDAAKLDNHPELINCRNGTLNLRTCVLRPHSSADYLTHCAPVNYNESAECPRFERFLREILDEERASFLQRWLGYCITGETREQKIVLHIGDGANGKGTLIRSLKAVLGSYVHTAAPGLFTSGSERHPTEIADLLGRRLVVSQESDDGAVLREGFLKHASGEDELSARYMYRDFFTFTPTFKLQLLTNHKPVVKGSDFGIWRRLILLWYSHKYGSQTDIGKGKATRLIDPDLEPTLQSEMPGIFAWLVRGAKEWYQNGLHLPDSVIEARESYQNEQDRVQQFVAECCMVGPDYWTAHSGPNGIYPEYAQWCKHSGYHALSMNRFTGELTRVVPSAILQEKKTKSGGKWKTQRGIRGVMVNPDDDGGVTFESDNGDLL